MVKITSLISIYFFLMVNDSFAIIPEGVDRAMPTFLVHGSGNQKKRLKEMDQLKINLVKLGLRSKNIFLIKYDFKKNAYSATSEVIKQVLAKLRPLPPTAKFNMIGHSLGHFMALNALLNSDILYLRVNVLVGLAGYAKGSQDFSKNGLIGRLLSAKSETVKFVKDSAQMRHYLYRNSAKITNLKKCSLFSINDKLVANSNSSRFYDRNSRSYRVLDNEFSISKLDVHLKVATEMETAQTIVRRCFNRFEW